MAFLLPHQTRPTQRVTEHPSAGFDPLDVSSQGSVAGQRHEEEEPW
jgi:hypothetical protein